MSRSRVFVGGVGARRGPGADRRAFTLIEIMVVIGIMAAIAALAIPMVFKAMASARRSRLALDLQAIEFALSAYKTDFGDIPRVEAVTNPQTGALTPASVTDRPNPLSGAQVLCRALLAPGPATETGFSGNPVIFKQDGADGPGFRVRRQPDPSNPNQTVAYGKVYGPYLAQGKFKTSTTPTAFEVLLDYQGNPILYFPARLPKPPLDKNQGYLADSKTPPPVLGVVPYTKTSVFDARDNIEYFRRGTETDSNVTRRIRMVFGDYDASKPTASTNVNGAIDTGTPEKAIDKPYVLYCAGKDGVFGPNTLQPSEKEMRNLDDVTNVPAGE